MKKILSLFVIVAMMFTMSITSFAATVSGMKTTITETDTDITVTITVGDVTNFSGITGYLVTDKVNLVADSYTLGSKCSEGYTVKADIKKDGIKFTVVTTDTTKYITTTGDFEVISYKVTKKDPATTLSASDFKYGTGTLNASKVTCASCGFYTAKDPTNKLVADAFTIEYIAPAGEDWKTTVDTKLPAGTDVKFPATKDNIGGAEADLTTDNTAKKVVIFAKNTSSDALVGSNNGQTANYGITIGGMFYPGFLDVPTGANWSIILVDPNGELTGKSFSASATVAGETKPLSNVSFE